MTDLPPLADSCDDYVIYEEGGLTIRVHHSREGSWCYCPEILKMWGEQ